VRRWIAWSALGVACYLLFLIITLPAPLVWDRFAPVFAAA
jgi:hypothetical protein